MQSIRFGIDQVKNNLSLKLGQKVIGTQVQLQITIFYKKVDIEILAQFDSLKCNNVNQVFLFQPRSFKH